MQTKVILKQDVHGLGEEGDIKKVKAGYARNYLIPYSYAVIYNKYNLQKLEDEKEAIDERKEKKLESSKSLVEKIDGLEIEFEENISEKGRLFGSITSNNIAIALKEKGFDIEKRYINLKTPIKETGKYEISLVFYGNKTAKINVVIKEKQADTEISKEDIEEEIKNEETKEADNEETKEKIEIAEENKTPIENIDTDTEEIKAVKEIDEDDEKDKDEKEI